MDLNRPRNTVSAARIQHLHRTHQIRMTTGNFTFVSVLAFYQIVLFVTHALKSQTQDRDGAVFKGNVNRTVIYSANHALV